MEGMGGSGRVGPGEDEAGQGWSELSFHELLRVLRDSIVDTSVEVRISASQPEGDDRACVPIAGFDGAAESLEVTPRGARLRMRMSPRHRSARAFVELAREEFGRAAREEVGDLPWSLHIWQSGVEISIETYGPGAYHVGDEQPAAELATPADVQGDDLPF